MTPGNIDPSRGCVTKVFLPALFSKTTNKLLAPDSNKLPLYVQMVWLNPYFIASFVIEIVGA